MRAWTVHAAAGRTTTVPATVAPKARLVPEGFCGAGLLFGPFWLLGLGLWLPALVLLGVVGSGAFLLPEAAAPLALGVHLLTGLTAHDLERAALHRRGLPLAGVVVAPSRDSAILRLWRLRPDLARGLAS